uniref:Malectin domain-containing protein n=1 Tax=Steinernema glaseri TaxID=37863 RepID=A0A1I8AS21_9BILA
MRLLPLLLFTATSIVFGADSDVAPCDIGIFHNSYLAVPNTQKLEITLIDGNQPSLLELSEKINDYSNPPGAIDAEVVDVRVFYTKNYEHLVATAKNMAGRLDIGIVAVKDLLPHQSTELSLIGSVNRSKVCRFDSTFYDMKKEAIGFDDMAEGKVLIKKNDSGTFEAKEEEGIIKNEEFCNTKDEMDDRVTDLNGKATSGGKPFYTTTADKEKLIQLESGKFMLAARLHEKDASYYLTLIRLGENMEQNLTCYFHKVAADSYRGLEQPLRILLIPKEERYLGVNLQKPEKKTTTSPSQAESTSSTNAEVMRSTKAVKIGQAAEEVTSPEMKYAGVKTTISAIGVAVLGVFLYV